MITNDQTHYTEYEQMILNHVQFPVEITSDAQANIVLDLVMELERFAPIPNIKEEVLQSTASLKHTAINTVRSYSQANSMTPQSVSYAEIHVSGLDSSWSIAEQIQELYEESERERRGITVHPKTGRYQLSSVRLAEFIRDEYPLFTLPNGESYLFEDSVYRKQEDLQLATLVGIEVKEWAEDVWSKSKQSDYIEAIKQETLLNADMEKIFESVHSYINFPNGFFDLDQMQFFSEEQEHHFFTSVLPYSFDEDAKCPQFEKTINSIFEQDQERIAVFQQLFGYLLTHEMKLQKGFFFLGSGSNGKSLLIKIMSEVIGQENITNTSLQTLSKPFGYSELLHRKVMFSTENEMQLFENTENFKAVTGGDRVRLERKHQDAFTTRLTTKVVVALNSMMDSNDVTPGFFRRVFILPFNQQYVAPVPKELEQPGVLYMDLDLEEKLREELPGIFNFAIEGLKQLRANHYCLPDSKVCKQAEEDYRISQQPLPTFFEECFQIDSKGKFSRPELFDTYEKWRSTIAIPVRTYTRKQLQDEFQQYLKSLNLVFEATKIQGYYYYKGIQKK